MFYGIKPKSIGFGFVHKPFNIPYEVAPYIFFVEIGVSSYDFFSNAIIRSKAHIGSIGKSIVMFRVIWTSNKANFRMS